MGCDLSGLVPLAASKHLKAAIFKDLPNLVNVEVKGTWKLRAQLRSHPTQHQASLMWTGEYFFKQLRRSAPIAKHSLVGRAVHQPSVRWPYGDGWC